MTPDELLAAWTVIIYDVFGTGKEGCFRTAAMTLDEWKAVDDRWLTLKQMNLKRLAMKGEADAGRKDAA
jgi:hypothetical protein